MAISKYFAEPICRTTASIAEEKIYGFKRRCFFAPSVTGNCNIKFCTVAGAYGAESQSHSHPGDEIVFTLENENINYLCGQKVTLRQNQAIAIPHGTEHITKVVKKKPWKGLSFYCDDCPLIKNHTQKGRADIVTKSIEYFFVTHSNDTIKKIIFSPEAQETSFMELFAFVCNKPIFEREILQKGETVYFTISGNFYLSWGQRKMLLGPGAAAIVPAGLLHNLIVEDLNGCRVIACTCSSCPLI